MANMEYLLANGVKIAMVFRDRDYRCPWIGGEATAKAALWKNQKGFLAAGYEEIQGLSNNTLRGLVKQYSQLPLARLMDAGHAGSSSVPETVFRIFQRAMLGNDVATGKTPAGPQYHTTGPTDSWGWQNTMPTNCAGHAWWRESSRPSIHGLRPIFMRRYRR